MQKIKNTDEPVLRYWVKTWWMNKARCMQHFVWTGIYNNNSYSIEVTKSSNITSDNDINIMTNTEDRIGNKKTKQKGK